MIDYTNFFFFALYLYCECIITYRNIKTIPASPAPTPLLFDDFGGGL